MFGATQTLADGMSVTSDFDCSNSMLTNASTPHCMDQVKIPSAQIKINE
jgi:hypothetical protein